MRHVSYFFDFQDAALSLLNTLVQVFANHILGEVGGSEYITFTPDRVNEGGIRWQTGITDWRWRSQNDLNLVDIIYEWPIHPWRIFFDAVIRSAFVSFVLLFVSASLISLPLFLSSLHVGRNGRKEGVQAAYRNTLLVSQPGNCSLRDKRLDMSKQIGLAARGVMWSVETIIVVLKLIFSSYYPRRNHDGVFLFISMRLRNADQWMTISFNFAGCWEKIPDKLFIMQPTGTVES